MSLTLTLTHSVTVTDIILCHAQLASAGVVIAPYGLSTSRLEMVINKPTPALHAATAFLSIGL